MTLALVALEEPVRAVVVGVHSPCRGAGRQLVAELSAHPGKFVQIPLLCFPAADVPVGKELRIFFDTHGQPRVQPLATKRRRRGGPRHLGDVLGPDKEVHHIRRLREFIQGATR